MLCRTEFLLLAGIEDAIRVQPWVRAGDHEDTRAVVVGKLGHAEEIWRWNAVLLVFFVAFEHFCEAWGD